MLKFNRTIQELDQQIPSRRTNQGVFADIQAHVVDFRVLGREVRQLQMPCVFSRVRAAFTHVPQRRNP